MTYHEAISRAGRIAAALAALAIGSQVQAAEDLLHSTRAPADSTIGASVVRNLILNPSVLSYRFIGVRPEMLDRAAPELAIALPGMERVKASLVEANAIDDETMSWSGRIQYAGARVASTDSALFIVTGDRVSGQIRIKERVFEILTAEEGGHYLLVERDFSALPQGDDSPALVGDENALRELAKPEPAVPGEVLERANTRIRVLQIATRGARNQAGGRNAILDRMRFFIAQGNDVLRNTAVPVRLANAGLRTPNNDITESNGSLILNRLSNTNDGRIYDNLAERGRNNTRADIVGLVVRPRLTATFGDICGQADRIAATETSAFFVIDYTCTNFTFVHEIGHLVGARHELTNDPSLNPFPFGHGFVSVQGNFRTVMATGFNPQPRIPVFSSPDRAFNGIDVGTGFREDNARVWRQRRNTVASFR